MSEQIIQETDWCKTANKTKIY